MNLGRRVSFRYLCLLSDTEGVRKLTWGNSVQGRG